MFYLATQMWLCLLLAFLLGLLLGWLLWARSCQRKLDELEARYRDDLDACRSSLRTAQAETRDLKSAADQARRDAAAAEEAAEAARAAKEEAAAEAARLGTAAEEAAEAARAAKEEAAAEVARLTAEAKSAAAEPVPEAPQVGGPAVAQGLMSGAAVGAAAVGAAATGGDRRDDLKKIEGIGPKIESLLNDDGLYTWAQLASSAVERLQRILDAAGPRYRVHDPASWPDQARLAAEGRWDELEKLQDLLQGGRLG